MPVSTKPPAAPDGSVALVADDGMVRLIRLTDGEAGLTARTPPPGGRRLMNAVTRDPGRDRVIAGTHDHKLHVFSGAGLESQVEVALGQGPINSIRVAECAGHEGALFAACYSGAIVRVSPDGRDVQAHALHDGAVKALRLHPSEPVGVSCSADGGLLSWTLDGAILREFPGHTAIVDDVDISPDGSRIASASRDFTLNVYDVADARLTHSIELGRRSPKSLCFWDDETVIVGDYWGALVKADLRTGRVTRQTIAANGISSLSRSPDGLVASSYDGGVYLVSVPDLSVRNVYRAMTQRVGVPDLSPPFTDLPSVVGFTNPVRSTRNDTEQMAIVGEPVSIRRRSPGQIVRPVPDARSAQRRCAPSPAPNSPTWKVGRQFRPAEQLQLRSLIGLRLLQMVLADVPVADDQGRARQPADVLAEIRQRGGGHRHRRLPAGQQHRRGCPGQVQRLVPGAGQQARGAAAQVSQNSTNNVVGGPAGDTDSTGQAGGGVLIVNGQPIAAPGAPGMSTYPVVYYAIQENDVFTALKEDWRKVPYYRAGPNKTNFPITLDQAKEIQKASGKTLPNLEQLAIEVKTAWVDTAYLTTAQAGSLIRIKSDVPAFTQSTNSKGQLVLTWDGETMVTRTLAMVGMHVVGSVNHHPEMVWATFEIELQQPRRDLFLSQPNYDPATKACKTSTSCLNTVTFSQTSSQSSIFYNGTKGASDRARCDRRNGIVRQRPQYRQHRLGRGDLDAGQRGTPQPLGQPAADHADPDRSGRAQQHAAGLADESLQPKLAASGTTGKALANYFLVGAIWSNRIIPPQPGYQLIGSQFVANTTMETFQQVRPGNPDPNATASNCFSCHGEFNDKDTSSGHQRQPRLPQHGGRSADRCLTLRPAVRGGASGTWMEWRWKARAQKQVAAMREIAVAIVARGDGVDAAVAVIGPVEEDIRRRLGQADDPVLIEASLLRQAEMRRAEDRAKGIAPPDSATRARFRCCASRASGSRMLQSEIVMPQLADSAANDPRTVPHRPSAPVRPSIAVPVRSNPYCRARRRARDSNGRRSAVRTGRAESADSRARPIRHRAGGGNPAPAGYSRKRRPGCPHRRRALRGCGSASRPGGDAIEGGDGRGETGRRLGDIVIGFVIQHEYAAPGLFGHLVEKPEKVVAAVRSGRRSIRCPSRSGPNGTGGAASRPGSPASRPGSRRSTSGQRPGMPAR